MAGWDATAAVVAADRPSEDFNTLAHYPGQKDYHDLLLSVDDADAPPQNHGFGYGLEPIIHEKNEVMRLPTLQGRMA